MAGSGGAAGTAGAGQGQPTEVHADQPQRQGHDGPGSPAAGTETTGRAAQMRHTEDHTDQPQRQGHDCPGSPVAGADTTGGAGKSQPTDNQADQSHHGGYDGPGSPIGDDVDTAIGVYTKLTELASVRYLIADARAAVDFYTIHLGFAVDLTDGAIGITNGRARAIVAAVVGLISLVVGGLALARSRRSRSAA